MKSLFAVVAIFTAGALAQQDPKMTKEQRHEIKKQMNEHWGDKADKYDSSHVPSQADREALAKDKTAWPKYFTDLAGIWTHLYKED